MRYRHNRIPRKLTLGSYPAIPLPEARQKAQEALLRVARGGDPAAEKKAAQRRALEQDDFGAVARAFIEKHCKPKLRTWEAVERILSGPIDRWGDRKIGSLQRSDIIRWQDSFEDCAPIQGNRALAHLRKLFNWAIERDLVTVNPCTGVKPRAAEVQRERVLSDDELLKLWNAAGDDPLGAVVKVLILTGQRRNEVGGMRWSELDLERKLWTLPCPRVKNKTEHTVPLSDAVIDFIQAQPRIVGCNFVFTQTGRGPVNGFSRHKARVDQDTGITGWRLHDVRRTVASGMARLGTTLPVIEKVLNHRSGSFAGIVSVYQRHSFADEKRAALDAWARFVLSLDKPADNVVPLKAVGAGT